MDGQAIYRNGRDHLKDEWEWLDAGLFALLEAGGGDPFTDPGAANLGLLVAQEELRQEKADGPESAEIWQTYTQFRREQERRIAGKVRNSFRAGVFLPLPHLVGALRLSVWECRFLTFCLASEWNRKYEKWLGYLNDDVTCRSVTPDLAMRLLCDTDEDRQYARLCLNGNGALRRLLLDSPEEENVAAAAQRPKLKTPLRLDERTVSFLLETERIDARLANIVIAYDDEQDSPPDGEHPDDAVSQMLEMWSAAAEMSEQHNREAASAATDVPFLYLWGPEGGGKSSRLRKLAALREQRLLAVDVKSLPQDTDSLKMALSRIVREAALTDAAIVFEESEFTPGAVAHKAEFSQAFRDYCRFVRRPLLAWTSRQQRRRAELPVPETAVYREAKVAAPAAAERMTMWISMGADEETAQDLGNKLRFTRGQIARSWERALLLAADRGEDVPSRSDLELTAHTQFNHRLAELADPIRPARHWEDLILPAESLSLIREACNRFKHRETVLGRWGFGRKLPYGTGVHMLFAGPPGTGKTMTAEIVARELGLELYRIDLSRIVSKYIGETEQRLKELFDEAERSGAILFFDEGDALFGKRTEVKDSHDRYANMEASYLLQRIEAYDGVTILATNLMQNLEEALIRRISVVVKFPAPGPVERELIFRAHLPPEAPVADDLDLEFLAERMEVSGGQIKNIVLAAAFMAASEQKPISMSHLVRASGQELRKTGKIFVKEIFSPYTEDL